MTEYVSVADVDKALGDEWANDSDKPLFVALVNAYISNQHLNIPSPTPEVVVQAAVVLAKAASSGDLYAQTTEGALIHERAEAGDVMAELNYAAPSTLLDASRQLPQWEQIVQALLGQFKGTTGSITVGYGGGRRCGC
ncbi:hypothetical protein R84981_002771 [Carnimonas sp. R-84981]|uniref:hypothetical protein n=1 Tax=Carnimonas bestiolae TaxID=3402172 RepID=UPI003EDCAFC4